MKTFPTWIHLTELDRASAAELTESITQAEEQGAAPAPRSYPGYPQYLLPRPRLRWRPALDRALSSRRCERTLDVRFPDPAALGRLLGLSHGVCADGARGPAPSAGGLQALELYFVHWRPAWLPEGAYHYDRTRHALSQVRPEADSQKWTDRLPSLLQTSGGALVWLLVGDAARVAAKYGRRAERFLLLEAGHLMQNLCLVSYSLGMSTVPLGGCYESEICRELRLPPDDRLLYCGVCGYCGSGGAARR